MKLRRVRANDRTRCFEAETPRGLLSMPYAKVSPEPSRKDRVIRVYVDPELGREAFSYELASGREGSVHADALLEEHEDPAYMIDLMIHRLTVEARRRMDATHLSSREVCRRLGTSPAQLYRLLDETNGNASVRQLMVLLSLLGCQVELCTRTAKSPKRKASGRAASSVRGK